METISNKTEDFIYYWKWLFFKLITYLLDSYLYLIISLIIIY